MSPNATPPQGRVAFFLVHHGLAGSNPEKKKAVKKS
jgi:hypothetical protein